MTDAPGWAEVRRASPADLETLRQIDDDAVSLYLDYGLKLDLALDHPFVRAELERWLRSAELGNVFLALDPSGEPIGFAALGWVDARPYLDELAVRRGAMRRGVGGQLLERAAAWARAANGSDLWLTTYAHLPFNRLYYERRGYLVVPEAACGPGIVRHLEDQRRHLPAPEQRVAMRRPLADHGVTLR
jgi:GNAT superfamily N-acetyltransferase